MQPILPSVQLPKEILAGKAIAASCCIVNDLAQAFPDARCEWHLEGVMGDVASASFQVNIPADGISANTHLTLPSLRKGNYKLTATITSNSKIIGENWYDIIIK